MKERIEHAGSNEEFGTNDELPESDQLGDFPSKGTHDWTTLTGEAGSLEWQQQLRQISPLAWALWTMWQERSGEHPADD